MKILLCYYVFSTNIKLSFLFKYLGLYDGFETWKTTTKNYRPKK